MQTQRKDIREIHRLLDHLVITPDNLFRWFAEKDQVSFPKEYDLLRLYLKNHCPNELYRFRKATDETIDAFKDDRLPLCRADFFNDPYDCMLYFDEAKLIGEVARQIQDKNMQRHLAQAKSDPRFRDAFKVIEDHLDEYRYAFLDHISKVLPSVSTMLQKSMNIACFTEDVASPVMWAHYADNHKGFAIAYKFHEEMFYPNPYRVHDVDYDWYGWRSLLPVRYSDQRVDATALADWYCRCKITEENNLRGKEVDLSIQLPNSLLKTKIGLHKSSAWQYEKEWRLIYSSEWPNQADDYRAEIEYPSSAVYLGCNIEPAQEKALVDISKSKSIPVFKMYVDYRDKAYRMAFAQLA